MTHHSVMTRKPDRQRSTCYAASCHQVVIWKTVSLPCQLERLACGPRVEGRRLACSKKGGNMAENDGTEAAGAGQTVEVEGRRFLEPDSALVRTAVEMLATHTADDAEGES